MDGSKPNSPLVDERTSGRSANVVRTQIIIQRSVCPTNLPNNRTWRRLFPLPVGQGEGNRVAVRYSDSDHSRNCRTLRVLKQSRTFPKTLMRELEFSVLPTK